MARIKLTKRVIDALPLPDNPRGKRYYDGEKSCFGVAVYPTGKKSFFIEYGPRGRQRRMTLGPYGTLTLKAARAMASVELAKALQGLDPLETRQEDRTALTFGGWVDIYLKDVRARKKNPREDERYLAEARKRWESKLLSDISVSDVQKLFDAFSTAGKRTAANRLLASVRACLQAAWRMDKLPSNPAMRLKPLPEGQPRSRVLTDKELERLITQIGKLKSPHVRAAFALLIETGARQSEVLNAKWEDFDLGQGFWRIPSTKAGRPQTMPLAANTIAKLQNLPRFGEYVAAGRHKDKPRRDLKRPWAKLQDKAKLEGVNIHDLRRTFGLHVSREAGLHVASKLLRHSDIRVTERHYAPLGIEELRGALERREAEIIPLRGKKAKVK